MDRVLRASCQSMMESFYFLKITKHGDIWEQHLIVDKLCLTRELNLTGQTLRIVQYNRKQDLIRRNRCCEKVILEPAMSIPFILSCGYLSSGDISCWYSSRQNRSCQVAVMSELSKLLCLPVIGSCHASCWVNCFVVFGWNRWGVETCGRGLAARSIPSVGVGNPSQSNYQLTHNNEDTATIKHHNKINNQTPQ